MTDYRLRDITRRMFQEVFDRGNLDAIDEYVAEDIVENEPMPPGIPQSREGFRQWVQLMREGFPDLSFQIQDMTVDGDKVWVRGMVHGTNTGSFMGIPATGKKVQAEAIDIIRFVEDKMVEHWGVYDQFAMLQQLGLVQSSGEQHM